MMADQETISPAQDMAAHARDYDRFTRMFKWGTVICALIGFVVVFVILK